MTLRKNTEQSKDYSNIVFYCKLFIWYIVTDITVKNTSVCISIHFCLPSVYTYLEATIDKIWSFRTDHDGERMTTMCDYSIRDGWVSRVYRYGYKGYAYLYKLIRIMYVLNISTEAGTKKCWGLVFGKIRINTILVFFFEMHLFYEWNNWYHNFWKGWESSLPASTIDAYKHLFKILNHKSVWNRIDGRMRLSSKYDQIWLGINFSSHVEW